MLSFLIAASAVAESAIGRLNHAGYRQQRHCTAVLVAPKIALTAAHCLEGLKASESHLLLGYDRGQWREHLRPDRLVPLGRDLAALCLARPAKTQPLPMAKSDVPDDERLTAAGYGRPAVHRLQRHACRVVARDGKGALRLDCPLSPGNSGGPLLSAADGDEAVIAITVASNATQSLAIEIGPARQEGLCR